MRPALTPAQAKAKNAYLLKNYHITLAQYQELEVFQEHKCYICRESANRFKNGMAVDHCHTTGTVRGLLCWKCNRALGKFYDNAEFLQRASNYINFPPTYILWGVSPITTPGRVGTKARAKAIAKFNGTTTTKRRKKSGANRRIKRPIKI